MSGYNGMRVVALDDSGFEINSDDMREAFCADVNWVVRSGDAVKDSRLKWLECEQAAQLMALMNGRCEIIRTEVLGSGNNWYEVSTTLVASRGLMIDGNTSFDFKVVVYDRSTQSKRSGVLPTYDEAVKYHDSFGGTQLADLDRVIAARENDIANPLEDGWL